MNFPSRETVERLRREYPAGTRVELVLMDDCQAPPVGTHGTVLGVDDTGSLLMKWDNGSALALIPGEDSFRRLTDAELAEEQDADISEEETGPVMGM